MPIYVYQCGDCLGEWKENHGMTEDIEDCFWCESKNINRKPSEFVNLSKKINEKKNIGDITKEFIESSRQDIKDQKKDLSDKR